MNKSLIVVGIATALVLAGCGGTQTAAPETVTAVSTVTTTVTSRMVVLEPQTTSPTAETNLDASSQSIGPVDRAKCRTIMEALKASGADLMSDQIVAGGSFTAIELMQPIAAVQLALGAMSDESDAELPGMVSVRATSQKLWDIVMTSKPDETELYADQLAFALSVTGLRETCGPFAS